MRLTKRQLKRIIREEYSRLKRRGLIREFDMDAVHADYGHPDDELEQDEYSEEEMNMIADYDLGTDELSDEELNMYADYDMKVPVDRMSRQKAMPKRDRDFSMNESRRRRRSRRRGLIKESGFNQDRVDEMIMFLDDLMSSERGMDLEYGGEEAIIAELERAFPDATIDEVMEAMASF